MPVNCANHFKLQVVNGRCSNCGKTCCSKSTFYSRHWVSASATFQCQGVRKETVYTASAAEAAPLQSAAQQLSQGAPAPLRGGGDGLSWPDQQPLLPARSAAPAPVVHSGTIAHPGLAARATPPPGQHLVLAARGGGAGAPPNSAHVWSPAVDQQLSAVQRAPSQQGTPQLFHAPASGHQAVAALEGGRASAGPSFPKDAALYDDNVANGVCLQCRAPCRDRVAYYTQHWAYDTGWKCATGTRAAPSAPSASGAVTTTGLLPRASPISQLRQPSRPLLEGLDLLASAALQVPLAEEPPDRGRPAPLPGGGPGPAPWLAQPPTLQASQAPLLAGAEAGVPSSSAAWMPWAPLGPSTARQQQEPIPRIAEGHVVSLPQHSSGEGGGQRLAQSSASSPLPGSHTTYSAMAGDGLFRIAVRHGVSLADVIAANPQYAQNPDLLHPGNLIRIPAAAAAGVGGGALSQQGFGGSSGAGGGGSGSTALVTTGFAPTDASVASQQADLFRDVLRRQPRLHQLGDKPVTWTPAEAADVKRYVQALQLMMVAIRALDNSWISGPNAAGFGVFDRHTDAAVRLLQRKAIQADAPLDERSRTLPEGFAADGVVGPHTWAILGHKLFGPAGLLSSGQSLTRNPLAGVSDSQLSAATVLARSQTAAAGTVPRIFKPAPVGGAAGTTVKTWDLSTGMQRDMFMPPPGAFDRLLVDAQAAPTVSTAVRPPSPPSSSLPWMPSRAQWGAATLQKDTATRYYDWLDKYGAPEGGLTTKLEAALFLGHVAYECLNFMYMDEPSSEERFRGRGPLMVRGEAVYKAAAAHFGDATILERPDLVAQDLELGMRVALWFWRHYVGEHCLDEVKTAPFDAAYAASYQCLRHVGPAADAQPAQHAPQALLLRLQTCQRVAVAFEVQVVQRADNFMRHVVDGRCANCGTVCNAAAFYRDHWKSRASTFQCSRALSILPAPPASTLLLPPPQAAEPGPLRIEAAPLKAESSRSAAPLPRQTSGAAPPSPLDDMSTLRAAARLSSGDTAMRDVFSLKRPLQSPGSSPPASPPLARARGAPLPAPGHEPFREPPAAVHGIKSAPTAGGEAPAVAAGSASASPMEVTRDLDHT